MPKWLTDIFVPGRFSAFASLCADWKLLGIDDPHGKDRKRLITFVEIDRCATDRSVR